MNYTTGNLTKHGDFLAARDGGWFCHYCGIAIIKRVGNSRRGNTATIDHMHPVSRGGADTRKNMVLACWACNNLKRDRLYWEFKDYLRVKRESYPKRGE